jgi:serine/threonine-protein kinase
VSPDAPGDHVRAREGRDVWATSVVLWETLTGRSLFRAATVEETLRRIFGHEVPPPSRFAAEIATELDAIVLRGLARDPGARFASPRAMALELERWCASPREVAQTLAAMDLACVRRRARMHFVCSGRVSKM